jgi:hypothetical protein
LLRFLLEKKSISSLFLFFRMIYHRENEMKSNSDVQQQQQLSFRGQHYKDFGDWCKTNPIDGVVLCGNCGEERNYHVCGDIEQCQSCGDEEYNFLCLHERAIDMGLIQESEQ